MTYVDDVLAANPYTYWRFTEGKSYADEKARKHFTSGFWGDARQFPPATKVFNTQGATFRNGDYARTGESSDSYWPPGGGTSGGEVSFEFWMRPKRNRGREVILSHNYNRTPYNDPATDDYYLNTTPFPWGGNVQVDGRYRWQNQINGFEIYMVNGRLRISMSMTVTYTGPQATDYWEYIFHNDEVMTPNEWHHIVLSFSNAYSVPIEDVHYVHLYVDGEVKWSGPSYGFPFDIRPADIGNGNSAGLYVGRSSTSTVDQFHGDVDEIAFYSHALSPEVVTQHWESSGLWRKSMERSSVYEGSIWREESAPKSGVGPLFRLLNTEVTFDPETMIRMYRSNSSKFATSSSVGKEHSSGSISGDQAYNDLIALFRGLIDKGTITTPANNGIWTVGVGAATGGTFTLTYGGDTTAAIPYNATAADVRTALAGLDSIGVEELAEVTGAAPSWTIKFRGILSTGGALTIDGTALVGGAATSTSTAGGTARRWRFDINPFGADDPQTYEIQKGNLGQANAASQIKGVYIGGLSFRWTVGEATLSGDIFGDAKIDPFTMETAGITDIPVVPVDPSCISVWMGDATSGAGAPVKLKRLTELDLDLTGMRNPLKTLDCDVPGIAAGVDTAPAATVRMVVQHDVQGQAILQDMRDGTVKYIVFEAMGPNINANYRFRYRWVASVKILSAASADADGTWATTYTMQIVYSTALGTGVQVEIDTDLVNFDPPA